MPDYPPLSQLPGFIPAPKPGTPEFKAFVAQVFKDASANAAFVGHVSRLASQSYSHTEALSTPEKA